MTAPFAVPLSAALDRATELAGPAATLQAVRPLAGGSHASTYLVEIANPDRQMVLREFPMGDPAAANEERVLTALDGLGGLAPEFLSRGAGRDRPWVLITRMPGRADIVPDDPRAWAAQLGSTLAQIHGTSAKTIAALDSVYDRRGRDRLSGPAADIVDAAWEQRILAAPPVLTHGDFQSGNVIWDNGLLSGVIDWEGAVRGRAGHDIGWCRLDLYLLYDEQIADHFLAAYEAASATSLEDPLLWDLWTLARSHAGVETWVPNYRDLGRPDLTAQELRRRHTAWTTTVLQLRPRV